MNDDMHNNELFESLSPAEEAAVDRLLKGAAEADNAGVDYAGMLKGIKATARQEGIVVFPAAKKRRPTIKAILAGVGTAAAVFAVGLGVLAALKALPFAEQNAPEGITADVSDSKNHSAGDPVKATDAFSTQTAESGETEPAYVIASEYPPFTTDEPAPTEAAATLFPTETAMRGGITGYVELGSFETPPDDIDSLLPELLPSFMELADDAAPPDESQSLAVRAMGTSERGEDYYYTCRLSDEPEDDLDVGVAKYRLMNTGELSYVWRISENTWLTVELVAFDKTTADVMLQSLAAENCRQADRVSPVPTEAAVDE